jgi:hypothetical protein
MNEDEKNVTVTKLDTIEQLSEAVGVLAAEVVRLNDVLLGTGRLAQGMDARITLLTKLVDQLRSILEKHGLVPPLPIGDLNVN